MPGANGWATATLDEVPAAGGSSGEALEWKPLRHHFGVQAFGVNAWIAREAGEEVIEDHDELEADARHEELYVVTAGHATFTVDGQPVDAPAGTVVFVKDPAIRRVAVSKEPGTTVLAIGGWPDRAFEPSAWELKYFE